MFAPLRLSNPKNFRRLYYLNTRNKSTHFSNPASKFSQTSKRNLNLQHYLLINSLRRINLNSKIIKTIQPKSLLYRNIAEFKSDFLAVFNRSAARLTFNFSCYLVVLYGTYMIFNYWKFGLEYCQEQIHSTRRYANFWYYTISILLGYYMDNSNHDQCGRKMLELALKNGGVFVKVGQHLAAMSHVIPEDITKYLKCLQEECTPQSIENIKKVIENELTPNQLKNITDLCADPVGTASIAQVHKAKLNGRDVVIKVQHIDIAQNAEQDIHLLTKVVEKVKNSKTFGHKFNLSWMVKEIEMLLKDELDFTKEASNATEAKHNHGHLYWLVIPRVYHEYTTKRILIMDYEAGSQIDDPEFYTKNDVDPRVIINRISHLFNEMIFLKGFLHSDPHAGNLRIRKCGPIGPVQIILLDHGQYKRFSSVFQHNYNNFVNAIMTGNATNILKYSKFLDIRDENPEYEKHLAQQLACMLTGVDWDDIVAGNMTRKGRDNKNSWGDTERTKQLVDKHLDKALNILENIPSECTMIMKSYDLIRCLEHKLTDGASPESYLNLALLCLRGMKKLELLDPDSTTFAGQWPRFSRFWLHLEYLPQMSQIHLYQQYFCIRQWIRRKTYNLWLFATSLFGYNQNKKYRIKSYDSP